ncbi:membrane protein [Acinetobacter gyllenbergii]|uniref:DUF1615 domain-containing protein n=1 Tax=Acinetobacter gyllenbergii CIP 110306 = MTCC 11365 TaxID=1217657 RepID=A0A829HFR5_9GAMM|nr:DUF1615 family protein [Acinetobacter gyllenbergii]EPF80268.1 hypothetical protein F957_02342 [Acinetobacter gyllenbergii CIP 110306 = MTCC 11365]EPH35106.1 putative lipoprotein [Acinetobacter gyllenbergii CIP 110306 = MTCC 11365]ESK53139.1 hypothetical protein F987_01301 [Acinetobacter gyllenbergii NIPH 230]OBY74998.1 membrane protein [Acinetobacter gyllenbergii]GMA13474.1 membrane protein [Acinetobacter gyllenbergii]
MNQSFSTRPLLKTFSLLAISISLTACGDNAWWSNSKEPEMKAEQITSVLPPRVNDRQSWSQDIFDIMQQLSIPKTKQNVCSIVAVVDQESNFVADPAVPGLGEKAVKEINTRLKEKFEAKLGETIGGTVAGYFEDVLKNQPSPENNYMSQMRKVRTERELDLLYREIFDYMSKHYHVSALTGAAKLVGQDIGEKMNPITTLGSMQVHINYAKEHKRQSGNIAELRNDLYTQYGGLYYGIHRLMEYSAGYDKAIYRFADYNSGMYSSRNAAFQKMLEVIQEKDLDLDGDLLLYNKDGNPQSALSQSEKEVISAFTNNKILVTPRQIRADLKKEKEQKFEDTQTYLAVQKLYQSKTNKEPIYAMMPEVVISGPKLSRDYNTNWFASRVNGRYETCMQRAKRIKL